MKTVSVAVLMLATMLAGCFGGSDDALEPTGDEAALHPPGFTETHVFPGDYDLSGPYSRTLRSGALSVLPGVITWLENPDDGVRFPVKVWRPDTPEPVPVIAMFDWGVEPLTTPTLGWDVEGDLVMPLVDNFVAHGYAVAWHMLRGTQTAEGCQDFFGSVDRADVERTISWLADQPWSARSVGAIGISSGGGSAWMAAATGHPALRTIVPIAGVTDLFELTFANGTGGVTSAVPAFNYAVTAGLADSPRPARIACQTAWEGMAASLEGAAAPSRTGNSVHDYWAQRDQRPLVEADYNGSIFSVQGLLDGTVRPAVTYPWVHQLEEKGLVVKHLLGQWGHTMADGDDPGSGARWDWAEILLHWFDHELKGEATVDLGPRVQVQDSLGRWRSEDAWPPTDAAATVLYLRDDGTLGFDASRGQGTFVVSPDPGARIELVGPSLYQDIPCDACARFESAPLEEELRIAGTPRLPLTVVPSGPLGEIAAMLYVVAPDDTAQRVGRAMMDLRYADGTDGPSVVVPGQELVARMQLEPLDAVVPEGHRLVLIVSQLGSYGLRVPDPAGAPVAVVAGGESSRLEVMTFQRLEEDVFFVPPGAPGWEGAR